MVERINQAVTVDGALLVKYRSTASRGTSVFGAREYTGLHGSKVKWAHSTFRYVN